MKTALKNGSKGWNSVCLINESTLKVLAKLNNQNHYMHRYSRIVGHYFLNTLCICKQCLVKFNLQGKKWQTEKAGNLTGLLLQKRKEIQRSFCSWLTSGAVYIHVAQNNYNITRTCMFVLKNGPPSKVQLIWADFFHFLSHSENDMIKMSWQCKIHARIAVSPVTFCALKSARFL